MAKQSLRQQLEEAYQSISVLRESNRDMTERLRMFETEVKYLRRTDQRFDELLRGMCDGMKEANIPRRPH